MLTVTLAASLANLVSSGGDTFRRPAVLRLDAGDWAGIADELRSRFPRLADHVLAADGSVRRGFLVAINDEVSSHRVPTVHPGDDVFLLVQIAGG